MIRTRTLTGLIFLLFILGFVSPLCAQSSTPVQYVYDALGRLTKVVDPSGNVATYNCDALGNTVALADSTGAVQTSYTYDPFGNTTSTGAATTNSLQYTGRENDGTGLYYYRARYYNPTLQRFISEDPSDSSASGMPNFYAYASNDPVDRIDPTGLSDLLYLRGSQTLVLLDGNGNIVGVYPAGNNVSSLARNDDGVTPTSPYQPGTYKPGPYHPHPEAADPDSAFGKNGIFLFPRPGCAGCGVHSGRRNKPKGPRYPTKGCIRTTDEATRKILDLTNAGDPLKHLFVR